MTETVIEQTCTQASWIGEPATLNTCGAAMQNVFGYIVVLTQDQIALVMLCAIIGIVMAIFGTAWRFHKKRQLKQTTMTRDEEQASRELRGKGGTA